MRIRVDKKILGSIAACLFAAGMAVVEELSDQKNRKEMEDLKERVNKLEKEEEA